MQVRRSIFGTFGVIAVTLTAVFATAPAQATSLPDHGETSVVLHAPPAPKGARTSLFATAAASPTISPSTSTQHVASDGVVTCHNGTLCMVVWDPTTADYKVFFLYDCHKYSLSHWSGWGRFGDFQTGGVRSYFYGSNDQVLTSFTPSGDNVQYDWTPVWSVRNC